MTGSIVVADIGGTHARFALARRWENGAIELSHQQGLSTSAFATLEGAWARFAGAVGAALPRRAAIAVAAPVAGAPLRLTNNSWVIDPAAISRRLGLEPLVVINDFAAVAHAVDQLADDGLAHVAGPDAPLPADGVVTVLGPGTGLGVALLLRAQVRPHVLPSEGGHMDFAPVDAVDDRILALARKRHGRVSVERVCAGPGLALIRDALGGDETAVAPADDDTRLWQRAIEGDDALAAAALDRWCRCLGSVAGDLALAQLSSAVVLAGGVLPRLGARFDVAGFHARFIAKGRYGAHMERLPVRRIVHPEPGLLGAAAAFYAEHGA